jgi:hypothetical protein
MLGQLKKSAQMMVHSQALLAAQVSGLEKANKAASERKKSKKKRIQKGGDLSKAEADELLAQKDVEAQLEGEMREGRSRIGAGRGGKSRRTTCKEEGHNSRTCKKGTVVSNE